MARVSLIIRENKELDSPPLEVSLEPLNEVFVVETTDLDASTRRALVTDSPVAGAPPLGWVTMMKDGEELLVPVEYEWARETNVGAFYTSGTPTMFALPLNTAGTTPRASSMTGTPESTNRPGVGNRGDASTDRRRGGKERRTTHE